MIDRIAHNFIIFVQRNTPVHLPSASVTVRLPMILRISISHGWGATTLKVVVCHSSLEFLPHLLAD